MVITSFTHSVSEITFNTHLPSAVSTCIHSVNYLVKEQKLNDLKYQPVQQITMEKDPVCFSCKTYSLFLQQYFPSTFIKYNTQTNTFYTTSRKGYSLFWWKFLNLFATGLIQGSFALAWFLFQLFPSFLQKFNFNSKSTGNKISPVFQNFTVRGMLVLIIFTNFAVYLGIQYGNNVAATFNALKDLSARSLKGSKNAILI